MDTPSTPESAGGLRQQQIELKLRCYLDGIRQRGLISEVIADRARTVWQRLDLATAHRVPAPDVGPGPNGEVLFVWDTEEHHFEIELSPRETTYLFYRNRKTGSVWGDDWAEDASIPEEALRRLSAFWR